MKKILKKLWIILYFTTLFFPVYAQEVSDAPENTVNSQSDDEKKEKKKISFKDPEDGYFDLSQFLIEKHGFIPVPIFITDPAVGGFGGGIAPVFIQPNEPREKNGKLYPTPPDVAAVFGAVTANLSWGAGAMYTADIKPWDARFFLGAAYADVNLKYYFNLEQINKTVSAEFNTKAVPIFASIRKSLFDPRFSAGLEYVFTWENISMEEDPSHPYFNEIGNYIVDQLDGNVALLNLRLNFDGRDSTFTPNKGINASLKTGVSSWIFGSSYEYWLMEGSVYYYFPILQNLITGLRVDMQQAWEDIPFFIKPFVDMRGIPAARYSGTTTMLAEIEERWDFFPRWSLVAFGGLGTAFDDWEKIGESELAWSAGLGFRYLMAKQFGLRMGMDFAIGPEGFTWYVIFGNAWMRQ